MLDALRKKSHKIELTFSENSTPLIFNSSNHACNTIPVCGSAVIIKLTKYLKTFSMRSFICYYMHSYLVI